MNNSVSFSSNTRFAGTFSQIPVRHHQRKLQPTWIILNREAEFRAPTRLKPKQLRALLKSMAQKWPNLRMNLEINKKMPLQHWAKIQIVPSNTSEQALLEETQADQYLRGRLEKVKSQFVYHHGAV